MLLGLTSGFSYLKGALAAYRKDGNGLLPKIEINIFRFFSSSAS